ncbi:MAG: hypothetical protein KBA06_04340 [Saprospiraceae bacterium]|nr:hypothetical protein [Saprospiraceae bacterium]
MKKQVLNRKYNFPDADLCMLCWEKIKCANRDIEHFTTYSFDIDRLSRFHNKIENFKKLPDDDEVVGDQMILTEKKNAAANALKSSIRNIMTRVEVKFNNRSGRYRKFGTAKMGDMTDAQLLFCGRRVARVCRMQMDFLSDVGLNDSHIAKVLDCCKNFENALNIQQDKVADRDIFVEKRTELGNEIYDELIILCNIGKDIWDNKNAIFYENYVLYESNNEQKKASKEKLS